MTQKKIIFVITKGNWGGAQRYVYDLITNLPKKQFETKVVVGQGRKLPEKLKEAEIETISLPRLGRDINLLDDFKTFFSLIKIFWHERPDIVHLNSPKVSGLGALAARIAGVKKIIYTAHGWTFNEPRPWFSRTLIWLASWLTVILSHTTIIITRSEQAQGLKMPWCKNKIKLVHNGLAMPNFLPRETARKKLGYYSDKILIGTIAELHHNKGLEYLIKALAQIEKQDWQAVIIGDGEEKTTLESLISDLELENKIKLAGFINNAAEFLPAFDIFVLPSLKEGLPYVILEAGLAGLPVIATEVGGIPEVVIGGHSGMLVPAGKSKILARAIQTLSNTPVLRQELGQHLEHLVATEYSLTKMVEQTIMVYNNQ